MASGKEGQGIFQIDLVRVRKLETRSGVWGELFDAGEGSIHNSWGETMFTEEREDLR